MAKFLISLCTFLFSVSCSLASNNLGDTPYDIISPIDSGQVSLTITEAQEKYADNKLPEALELLRTISPTMSFDSLSQEITFNNLIGSCYLRLGKLDSAQYFLEQTLDATSSHNYPKKYAYATSYLAMIAEDQGDLTKAIGLYNSAIEVLETQSDTFRLAATTNNLGLVYDKTGNITGALDHYYRALDLFSQLKHLRAEISINLNIGKVHYGIENYEDALKFFHAGLQKSIKGNVLNSQANALNSIGAIYLDLSQLDSAKIYLQKSLLIAEKTKNELTQSTTKNNLSKVYKNRGDYERGIKLNQEALSHAQGIQNLRSQIFAYYELSQNFKLKGDLRNYRENTRIAASMADQLGEPFLINKIQNELYLIHKDINPQKALLHLEKSVIYKDSLINKANLIEATKRDLQYKFEKEQLLQDQELQRVEDEASLNKVKLKQQRFTYLFILVVATLLLGSLLVYLNQLRTQKELAVQKSIVKSQKITQLEKEKKILSMNAMIEGQESERIRIAKDLHDGLGGLLSTVKAHFSNIQSEIQKIESLQVYDRAQKMMDEACDEVRRISHNLMPGALRLEGLQSAIELFARELGEAHDINIVVEAINFNSRMSESQEVFTYRIIQEALNNIIKHADAKDVLIQISETQEQYHFIIEDDGKGFDPLQIQSGLGLKSIQSRVDYLKGQIDIDTRLGVGTTISFHIPKDPLTA